MEESLKILESVNQFYSQSFNQLVVITVAVLAFAGVIMPIIISLYQKRLFRIEHEEIKLAIKNELDNEIQQAVKDIQKKYEEKEEKYEARLRELDEKLEKEVAGAIGGNLHIQGNINLKEKNYLQAFSSLTRAAIQHLKAENEVNLRRVLGMITNKCLPKLNKHILETDDSVIEHFNELLEKLDTFNINRRYDDDLRLLNIKYKQAIKRMPEPSEEEN